MEGIAFLNNINMMVLASIVAAVLLAFILVVIIFSVKLRGCHEKNGESEALIEKQRNEIKMLGESLNEARIVNASQLQELGQQEGIRDTLNEEITRLENVVQKNDKKIETQQAEIMTLEKRKSELGANFSNAKEAVEKLEETLAHATKRNEFWVEQMAEVRTKYEALKLKVR